MEERERERERIEDAMWRAKRDRYGDIYDSQCRALTRDVFRCERDAEPLSDYCWQHRRRTS